MVAVFASGHSVKKSDKIFLAYNNMVFFFKHTEYICAVNKKPSTSIPTLNQEFNSIFDALPVSSSNDHIKLKQPILNDFHFVQLNYL